MPRAEVFGFVFSAPHRNVAEEWPRPRAPGRQPADVDIHCPSVGVLGGSHVSSQPR